MQNKANFPRFQPKIEGGQKNKPKTGARQRKLSDFSRYQQACTTTATPSDGSRRSAFIQRTLSKQSQFGGQQP
jgi:hypothetical protein